MRPQDFSVGGSSTNVARDTEVDDGSAADGLTDDSVESASYRQCVICNASPAFRCHRCASAFYCGKDCQRDDWKLHKRLCSKTSSFFATRPSPEHRACIFIPETRTELEWIWANTKIVPDDDCPWRQAQIKPWLGGECIHVGRTLIPLNPRRDRLLDHTVNISHREEFLTDGSGTNKCLLELAGTVPHTWKGPMVLVRQDRQTESCMDIRLEDLRHAIDYLSWYRYDGEYTQDAARIARMPYKPICAVKVNCKGDQAVFGLEPYIQIEINRHHYVFSPLAELHSKWSRPKIAELIGVPLFLRQSGHDQAWERDSSQPPNVYNNQPITFLNMCTDPRSPDWGWAPFQWQTDVGSVVVARADQQDITPKQLEVICSYCQTELQREFECSLGAGLVQRTKQYVLDMMTPGAFRQYFHRYREAKLEDGDEAGWEDEKCPV